MTMEMAFSVGDDVVHPRYGVGHIARVEHQQLVEGFEHYYVIEIPSSRLVVRVPVRKMEEFGVRSIITRAALDRVLETLRSRPRDLPDDANDRHDLVREKLRMGRSLEIAEVVRDLSWQEESDRLTKTDGRLLGQARELLASEIALVSGMDVAEAEETIDRTVRLGWPTELDPTETG